MIVLAAAAIVLSSSAAPHTRVPQKLTNENMVCRHMDEPGSRVAGRLICKTQSEWTNEQDEAQHLLQMRQGRDLEYPKPLVQGGISPN